MRIGLTGRICSGKSTVARMLAELGANVVDSDKVLKDLLLEKEIRAEVERLLGERIFDKDNWKEIIADKLFSDERVRERYCSLLYPLTLSRMETLEDKDKLNVWEVPLLYEAGWRDKVDLVILTLAPFEARLERAIKRGMSKEDFLRRDSLFLPDEEKVKQADFVINNDGSLEDLKEKVISIWNEINRKG